MFGLNKSDYSDREYKSYNLMTLGIMLALIHQTWQADLPGPIQIGLSLLVLVICVRAIIQVTQILSLHSFVAQWRTLIFYFFIVGILHFGGINLNIFSWAITQDLRYCVLFLMGGCLALSNRGMSYFHHIMKILAVLSVFAGIYSFTHLDMDINTIESRTNTWSLSYLLWWIPGSCFCYWGYYVLIMKKDKLFGYSVMFFYAILGLLFLKRAAVIDVLTIFVVTFLLSKRNKASSFVKILTVIILLSGLMYVALPNLFDSVINMMFSRFEGVTELEDVDRNIESEAYFNQANPLSLIFGNGIGCYFSITGTDFADRMVNAIHIGWANIIYKGGIIYALFYLSLYKTILGNIMHCNLSNFEKVCYGVAISHLISLIYAGSWTYTIDPFCISAPIFYATMKHHDEGSNIHI